MITRKIVVLFSAALLAVSCGNKEGTEIDIVPRPASATMMDGVFEITTGFKIQLKTDNAETRLAVGLLTDRLEAAAGITAVISDDNPDLVLDLEKSGLEPEGYELNVKSKGIDLKAADANGLFYGVQTLLQLLPSEIYADKQVDPGLTWRVPLVDIKDAPRYGYRGLHLDVARHYFPVSFIKKYLDYMAMHKLNKFHWHLTEDQGWRIEIKKYPELSTISAYRNETIIGHNSDKPRRYDRTRYGGVYTQEEVKEIVQYAKERFITVIPEIEMPGHSVEVLAAYPELSCTGGPFEVRKIWGISKDIYCAGKEETFEFLENVLTEVIALFPSKYIHIGGDEAPKDRWEKCPDCQKRIKDEDLHDEHELQSYFISRIEKFLNKHGRDLIGWDEILEGGLAPGATVMSWRGMKGGIAAARQKHDVIMSPTTYCYFDYAQAEKDIEPLAIGGYLPLEKVYLFDPTPADSLTKEEQKYIIGGQANVWTEYISTPEYCEYMLMPRISAVAEAVWTEKSLRSWDGFKNRMQKQYKRYMNMGVNFRIPTPVVEKDIYLKKGEEVVLSNPAGFGEIRYTLDGSEPMIGSPVYGTPLVFEDSGTVRSRIFIAGGRASSIITTTVTVE